MRLPLMELNAQSAYIVVGTLLTCHVIYRFVVRRLQARTLPPKYWSWEFIKNFDYLFYTNINPRNWVKFQTNLGPTYRVSNIFNPMSSICTGDPENVHAMLAGRDWGNQFRLNGMGQMFEKGLLTVDGDEWMRSRKMVRPAFQRNNLDDFEVLSQMTEKMIAQIEKEKQVVDVGALLTDAFLNTSMHFILGLDPGKEDDGRPFSVSEFMKLWHEGIMGTGLRLILEHQHWMLPKKRFAIVCQKLHSFIDFAIAKARQNKDAQKSSKSMVYTILPHAASSADARAQLMHTLFANQDTTSTLISNVVQILSTRPAIWTQLRTEVLEQGSHLFTFDNLRNNKVIQNIILEALRHRVIATPIGRRAIRHTILPKGGGIDGQSPLHIPAGTTGLVNLWSLHSDPKVYGADADEFKPERWNHIKPGTNEFLPFGAGGRACLGQEKAVVETAFVLSKLSGRFESVQDMTGEWKPMGGMTIKNSSGYKVAFKSSVEMD
ncbi:unnamed protein product [Periconia digitata]|uniref:Cytochrome P450 n=1 Tax=Periconia digitata TaxID=1303443 RepID=A0A9W4UKS5_9PLEO|nr:unnamed protein product [Periconia digitata]